MLVLFESWLPSDRIDSLWKGERSAGFDGQPRHLFTDMVILFRGWLRAPLCGVRSSGGMNQYAFCCAERFLVTQAGLSRHICNQHVHCSCHLWSSALTLKTIPGSDSHTVTDVPPHRHTASAAACLYKVLPTHRPICLIPFALSLCLYRCIRLL